jgi:hypothetical protein
MSGAATHRDSITSFALTSPTVYPLHLLLTTNYRLPADVDRNNLERHLTDADFDQVSILRISVSAEKI